MISINKNKQFEKFHSINTNELIIIQENKDNNFLSYVKIFFLFLIIFFIFLTFFQIKAFKMKVKKKKKFMRDNYLNKPIFKENDTLKEELFKFKTYSQFLEDVILFIPLFDIKNGFYIDVGAFEPVFVSVTKAFYLRGWHGINIEPQKDKIKLFNEDRPNDINLQMAVGKKKGTVKLYIYDQLSTIKKKYSKTFKSNETIEVKMDTMSNICKKYVPKGTKIDFCKIDVEGLEKQVLLGYDFINYRPKMFCIESTKPLSYIQNYNLWEDILIKNDFIFVYSSGVNRFYADKRLPDLIERCNDINNYLNIFIFKPTTKS